MNKQVEALVNDKRFKDRHLSEVKDVKWICPTGSVKLDIFLDGGIRPSYIRIAGEFESGKTSFALNVARIFQKNKSIKKPYVFVVNAEGRIRDEMLARHGLDTSPDKFYRLDCNISEVVFQMVRELIANNPEGYNYLFIVDSLDALCRQEDVDKTFEDAERVAGGALINSVLGKKTSLPLVKYGHCLIALSQTRTAMNTTGYGNSGPKTSISGGKAIGFYSSLIIDIKPLWTDLYIWQNPSAGKIEDKGKRLGHYCVMEFKKTMNEKTGQKVQFPIKYGAPAGEAIWKSLEFLDLCLEWDLLKKKGAWYNFDESLIKEFKDLKIELEESHQGREAIIKYLEAHPEVVQAGIEKFKKLIQNSNAVA